MLKAKNLEFAYSNGKVLKGVSFELKRGIGCLLGPNGAGKSTLLKCIAGILKPQSGRVELDGVELTTLGFKERAKFVSYAPQEFSINFPYTVFEVVLIGRNPHVNLLEGPKKEDEDKALRALKMLGIDDLKDRPFTSLSGGQKRLVLVARTLAQDGKLLVFDGPTSFLDFKNQLLVLSVIERIAKKLEKLILLSLHDPNLALTFCDEVFLMKNGKILMHGRVDEVINEEILNLLYGLKTRIVKIDGRKIVVPEKPSWL